MTLVVGIGASAGGLEAYRSFFAAMPPDSDMAFVLVQHLAPDHSSMLVELIGRSTRMPVVEATDGEPVQAGHVYVIPPDATLTIFDGQLQVSKPAPPRQHRWPIDTFFTSLAEDQGDCAVSIVLSGTGSDGSRGLRAVKEHGGLTLAQAGYDHVAMSGMPASAEATGSVDAVLPVEEMPERLLAHQQHLLAMRERTGDDGALDDVASHLRQITRLLLAHSGHDFSQYKEQTLVRRVQRRMQVLQTEAVPDYVARLRREPAELEHLFRELLIGVTAFFRDQDTFELLEEKVIPPLLADRNAADTLRIWVPGCATGEEAYSIAIAVKEAMAPGHGQPKLQIFATDIDELAIKNARAGRYRGPLPGLSPERTQRWFRQEGDDYVVDKAIREICIFSPHSAIKDPPFLRQDLISCRNLLIYMNTDLQERLVRVLHYALRPGGYLLLGPSEGLSRNARLFSVIDKKHRLYQRREDVNARLPQLPARAPSVPHVAATPHVASPRPGHDDSIERTARRLMERYSPAYVVIDAHCDVLRFHGDTGRYLQPTSGAATLNLFSLLHKGLRPAARSAVQQAFAQRSPVLEEGLSLSVDGEPRSLQLIVEPLPEIDGAGPLCLVAFRDRGAGHVSSGAGRGDGDQRVQLLEQELEAARLQLQTAIDQQETTNEELKASNEEFQSVNEELQSANEELETSKEEMQSINEELQIVNAELHSKNAALTHANSDLQNLMDSTQIATLFLDAKLRVTSFTPPTTALFHLREGDIGRPITEISARIPYPDLEHDVRQVGRDLAMVERVLGDLDQPPVFLLRMRPYRTVDNVIDGAVLTFTDITDRSRHEVERGLLAAIVDSSADMIIGHTLDGTITSWNAAASESLGHAAEAMIGTSLARLLPGGASQLPELLDCYRHSESSELEMEWLHQDASTIPVAVTCSPGTNAAGRTVAGSLIARDFSERQQSERHKDLMLGELNHRVKNTLASVQSIALQTLSNAATQEAFKDSFLARLQALSGTHNLLSRDAWTEVGLRELVHVELAPYQRDGQARADVDCADELLLSPKTALALGMTLHELTTNAVKHGALSVPEGRVSVRCEPQQRDGVPYLRLHWRESGGPAVTPPTRRGFGSRLIADGLAFELGGEVSLEYAPGGVVCSIDVPLSEDPE